MIAGIKKAKQITKTARMARIRSIARELIKDSEHLSQDKIENLRKSLQELAPDSKSQVVPTTFYTIQVDGVLIMQLKDQELATEISDELNKIL